MTLSRSSAAAATHRASAARTSAGRSRIRPAGSGGIENTFADLKQRFEREFTGRARNRRVRSDAWSHPARRGRRGDPALHPVERHARLPAGHRARHRTQPRAVRQHHLSRLHVAEGALDGRRGTGQLRTAGEGIAAEGLCQPVADRRACLGDVRCLGYRLARRQSAPMVGRTAGIVRPRPGTHAKAGRRLGGCRHAQARAGGTFRLCQHGGRGRRGGRQRGLGLRHGHRGTWNRIRVPWHLRRAVRRQRRLPAESGKCRALPSATPCPGAGIRWE